MNCSSGTGNPRARLRRPRHDSEKEAQGGKGDQPGQDDGRLRHVVRPAWSLDGGTRQIDFPSPSPGDFPSMLDGAVASVVAGPASMNPEEWVCPLLGLGPDAFNHYTEEFSARWRSESG